MFDWYFTLIMWLQVHHLFTMIFSGLLLVGLFGGGFWAMRRYTKIVNDSRKSTEPVDLKFTKKEAFYFRLVPSLLISGFVLILFFGISISGGASNDLILTRITHYQDSTRYEKAVVPSTSNTRKIVLLRKDHQNMAITTPLSVSQKTVYSHGRSYATVQLLKLNADATSLQKSWYREIVINNWYNTSFDTPGIKVTHYESLTN